MAFIDSKPILQDTAELRRRAQQHGYLFFRELLPQAAVVELQQQILELCQAHDFFERPPMLADGKQDLERLQAYYEQAYRLRDLHALPKHSAIVDVYTRLFGRQAVPHARTVLRTVPYGTKQVWPVHQDFLNVGTHDEVWNSWTPVIDCPKDLGAIWMLPGSHRMGIGGNNRLNDTELFFEAEGDLFDHPPAGLEWITDDLNIGDVVMFNAKTYHRGSANHRPGEFRISIDNCIQPIDTDFIGGAFELHTGDFGTFNQGVSWDQVYADWPTDDALRYYWHPLDLNYADAIKLEFANG